MMEYPELVVGENLRVEAPGRAHRARRLRHRLFVAVLSEPLLGRHAEGGPFVRPGDSGDRSVCVMVTAIVNLARSLGLTVVVEGTETEEQIAWLAALGHIEAQGFLFRVRCRWKRFRRCSNASAYAA